MCPFTSACRNSERASRCFRLPVTWHDSSFRYSRIPGKVGSGTGRRCVSDDRQKSAWIFSLARREPLPVGPHHVTRSRFRLVGTSRGTVNVNVDPTPNELSTVDIATQDAGELTAERESQARAAVVPVGAGFRLRKLLEETSQLLRRHADARVSHRERQRRAIGTATAASVMVPRSVNFAELESRFRITCRTLVASVLSAPGSPSLSTTRRLFFFFVSGSATVDEAGDQRGDFDPLGEYLHASRLRSWRDRARCRSVRGGAGRSRGSSGGPE